MKQRRSVFGKVSAWIRL